MEEQDDNAAAAEEEEDRCAEPFEAADDGTQMAMPEEGDAAGGEDGEQHKRDAEEGEEVRLWTL